MSPTIGLPPPPAEICLETSRKSRYLGGTLIAEWVRTLAEHLQALANPDKCRPECCPRCGSRLHVHSRPERHPKGDPSLPVVLPVLQFRCSALTCWATWRVLPFFLARHLWHAWKPVERAALPEKIAGPAMPIAERTRQRWKARLGCSARTLVVLLAMGGSAALEAIAKEVGLLRTRGDLVAAFARAAAVAPSERLASVGALVHRLERGIRLM